VSETGKKGYVSSKERQNTCFRASQRRETEFSSYTQRDERGYVARQFVFVVQRVTHNLSSRETRIREGFV
jgi:predicted transcriptional regulator of viral defense system